MPLQNVETFEGDIADEIKEKGNAITDIISSKGNLPKPPSPSSGLLLISLAIFGVFIVLILVVYYFLFYKPGVNAAQNAPTQQTTNTTQEGQKKIPLSTLLVKSYPELDGFVVSTIPAPGGYVIGINDYANVLGFIQNNENLIGDDLVKLFNKQGDLSPFSDVTVANTDMRVAYVGESTVAYAFVGTSTLIIADGEQSILSISSAILQK
jgi:hypothetical protein